MDTLLEIWARAEREFIRREISWLNAGGKLISPSGDEISKDKIQELETRLEHVQRALEEIEKARS